jgi:hypothetical protein
MAEQAIPFHAEPAKKQLRTERRAWVRFLSDQEVCCQPLASSEIGWPGQVRDVSLGGIALILSRRFEPGTALQVELPTKAEREPCRQLVRVVHATPQAKGRWIIGCAFSTPLSEDSLRRFLQE